MTSTHPRRRGFRRSPRRPLRPYLAPLLDVDSDGGRTGIQCMLQSVHFKCFRFFRGMLQVFHMYVVKVDRHVAYVVMVVHVCCQYLSLMFYLYFRRMLQVCLSECCTYFTHMLQVFYLDVANVCNVFSSVFSYFCKCFRRMVFKLPSDLCCKSCIHILQTYVPSVSEVCYKCFISMWSWCCTCCNDYTHMFQAHVLSVSSVSDVCCKYFIRYLKCRS
jgi:hypothetical protein